MTRDEFVVGYLTRSGLPPEYRTIDGFHAPDCEPVHALPCACGEEGCEGWAMVHAHAVIDHLRFYAPRPWPPAVLDRELCGMHVDWFQAQHTINRLFIEPPLWDDPKRWR